MYCTATLVMLTLGYRAVYVLLYLVLHIGTVMLKLFLYFCNYSKLSEI